MDNNISNGVVVVTGAGSGIGKSCAIEFAKVGSVVVCVQRSKDKLDKTLEIISAFDGKAVGYAMDATDSAKTEAMVKEIVDEYGKIDMWINNAGQNNMLGNMWELDCEQMWQETTVNLKSVLVGTKYAVNQMVKQGYGRVLNLGGGGVETPMAYGSAYAAAKCGIVRFTENVACELKDQGYADIKLFAFGPGLVHTGLTSELAVSDLGKKYMPFVKDMIDSGDISNPDDIAAYIIRVAQGEFDMMNGRLLNYGTTVEQADEFARQDKYVLRIK